MDLELSSPGYVRCVNSTKLNYSTNYFQFSTLIRGALFRCEVIHCSNCTELGSPKHISPTQSSIRTQSTISNRFRTNNCFDLIIDFYLPYLHFIITQSLNHIVTFNSPFYVFFFSFFLMLISGLTCIKAIIKTN